MEIHVKISFVSIFYLFRFSITIYHMHLSYHVVATNAVKK